MLFEKPRLRRWIRLRLAWTYMLRASDASTEPEAESKAKAVVSKRPSRYRMGSAVYRNIKQKICTNLDSIGHRSCKEIIKEKL